jgi:putative tricarboxylic transport membrane protein
VRILAVFSDKRMALLPQVPTAREQGVDVVVRKFRGLAAPGACRRGREGAGGRPAQGAGRARIPEELHGQQPGAHDDGARRGVRFTGEVATDIAQTFRELGITPR